MNTYRTQHFTLVELVDPETIRERGDRAWEVLQTNALVTLDALRDKFGPIVVNGSYKGKYFTESGLRSFTTETGSKWSMHKYGGAFDCKFTQTTPQEVFAYIMNRPEEFPLLTTMEDVEKTVTWLHFDVRNHSRSGIWIVDP